MFETICHKCPGTEKPYISVIVIAFDRKEYILEAVKSVLNQSLDRSKYEILVIKNYTDDSIDDFLCSNNVINIYSDDVSYESKLAYGIEKAVGKIVCFLDDDDMFLPNKLENIYSIFKENPNTVFVRNGTLNISNTIPEFSDIDIVKTQAKDDKVNKIKIGSIDSVRNVYDIIRKHGIAHTSSISIKKDFYMTSTHSITVSDNLVETFLLFWAISRGSEDNVLVFIDKELTMYRIHDSWTQSSIGSGIRSFSMKSLQLSNQGIETLERFKIIFNSNVTLKNYLELTQIAWKIQAKLTESKKCGFLDPASLIKIGLYKRDLQIFAAVPVAVLSFVSPASAGKIFRFGLMRVQSIKA